MAKELKEDVDIRLYTRNIVLSNENPENAQSSKELMKEKGLIFRKL